MAEIHVARIIHRTNYILHTSGNFKNTLVGKGSICAFVEGYIFVSFMPAFIYIAHKFVWLQRACVNIRLILIAYFKNNIVEAVCFSITNNMINRFAIYLIQCRRKNGFASSNV